MLKLKACGLVYKIKERSINDVIISKNSIYWPSKKYLMYMYNVYMSDNIQIKIKLSSQCHTVEVDTTLNLKSLK